MSESIKLIYRILKILEKSMDYSELDVDRLSPEALGTSLNRRNAILEMLLKKGYIDGITIKKYVDKESILGLGNIKITIFRGAYFRPPENKYH
ncbi:YjcQ family protein [Absicoccus porci]|uniref:YjcQ family protein n=1 Tax=Absicoccus porci TaxID=2486576 RepID=UPI003F8864F3